MGGPTYWGHVVNIMPNTPLSTLKAYVAFHFVRQAMPFLTTSAGDLNHAFYGQALSGQALRPPLWKRCASSTLKALWAIGDRMWMEDHEDGGMAHMNEVKAAVESMTENIRQALAERLEAADFLDESTTAAAKMKLAQMKVMVGWPDQWPSYPGLAVGENFFANVLSSNRVEAAREFGRMGQEVDKDRWEMNACEVNAYYSPMRNTIALPAGILQKPFFSLSYPMAMNFGAIGSVIGHEMIHGFDHSGSKYDTDGKLQDWWSSESTASFQEEISCVSDQYSNLDISELFTTQKGKNGFATAPLSINGQLTLADNLADIGGVLTALDAYQAWKANQAAGVVPSSFPMGMEGGDLTDVGVFWVAFGQNWCVIQTQEALAVQLHTDPHSPGLARAEGPVSNSPAFTEAMGCDAGVDGMSPEVQCKVW